MKYCLRIDEFWPEGLSHQKASDEMKEMGIGLTRGTIGHVIRNRPTNGEYSTPFKLAKYLSWKLEREISVTDLLVPVDK